MNRDNEQNNFPDIFTLIMFIAGIYLMLTLADNHITGGDGRKLGNFLRSVFGGGFFLIILFWLYICVAKLLKFRIPRFRRQIFGTLQLYISFAFLLGLLSESGYTSDWKILTPGAVGNMLAGFFLLNIGSVATFILICLCFLLAVFLFGSDVWNLSISEVVGDAFQKSFGEGYDIDTEQDEEYIYNNVNIIVPERERENKIKKPEPVKFIDPVKNLPEPKFEEYENNNNNNSEYETPRINPVEALDDLLMRINSGEFDAPEPRISNKNLSSGKIRRPLPDVTLPKNSENETFAYAPENNLLNNNRDSSMMFPPPLELFGEASKPYDNREEIKSLENMGRVIISTLKNFGVNAFIAHIIPGAQINQFQIELAPGTKINKISDLAEEIAMSLEVISVRIEAPIPGTRYAGIEVPKDERKIIGLRNFLESQEFNKPDMKLPLPLGVQVNSKIFMPGLETLATILTAGNSESGCGNFLHAGILSMCSRRTPDELKLLLADPGNVEFAIYEGLPHLYSRPVYEPEEILNSFNEILNEMDRRIGIFASMRVRSIESYNKKSDSKEKLPYIVVIINELAEIFYNSGAEALNLITHMIQKARASGIYLIISTQRPSAEFINPLIKAGIFARAAFTLPSEYDSRLIIDINGAEKLTGHGDLLFRSVERPYPLRLQAPYISEELAGDFIEYMINTFGRNI